MDPAQGAQICSSPPPHPSASNHRLEGRTGSRDRDVQGREWPNPLRAAQLLWPPPKKTT